MSQFIEMFSSYQTTPVGNYIEDSYPGEWGTEDKDGNGVKVVRTTNFTNSGKLDLTDVVTRSISEKKIERKTIRKYDTILERSGGTTDNPVGRVVLFEEDEQYLCNNFTQVLRFKKVDPIFAFYSLFYFYHTNKIVVRSMGSKTTGIQNLNMSKYLEIGIPNASDDEQKKFVAIAKQADKSKFGDFKSQFIEMFGYDRYSKFELDAIAKSWSKGQSFKKDNICKDGKQKCIHYGELFTEYGPVIDEVVSSTNSLAIKKSTKGDILFPASDVTPIGLARCSTIMQDDILLGGDIIILSLNGQIPEYVSFAINMQKEQLIKRVTGSVVRHMSAKSLKSLTIPLPPVDKQKMFVDTMRQADKSKSYVRIALKNLESILGYCIRQVA